MSFDPFSEFTWKLAHGASLELGPCGVLMGILNVTPDSFSDGGKFDAIELAVKQAKKMYRAGAAIIDIGGESTRPGAHSVSAIEEQNRVLPVIEALGKIDGLILSIDTWRAETADKALQAGAHIVNDVWGFQKDKGIAGIAKKHEAGCVLMHTGRERIKNSNVMEDQIGFLRTSLDIAMAAGLTHEQILLDPGFGFAKNAKENLTILAHFEDLFQLGQPVLTGTSRKRFIGEVTGRGVKNRDLGTAATTVVARMKGSAVIRVHDVPKNRDALRIADAVIAAKA
jgi:dihydropteroate synthase